MHIMAVTSLILTIIVLGMGLSRMVAGEPGGSLLLAVGGCGMALLAVIYPFAKRRGRI